MPEVTIEELCVTGALVVGDGYRTKRSEHGEPGYRILRVADVDNGSIRLGGPDSVRKEFLSTIGSKLSEPGDVLLTTKGTVGRVAIFPDIKERVVYSPQLCYFRVLDRRRIVPRYLAYWFKSEDFIRQASHRANNTDMAAYINLKDIRSLRLSLPSSGEQRAIAEVLGALDDKIAANERLLRALGDLETLRIEAVIASARDFVPLDSVATVTKGVSYRRHDLDRSRSALITLKSIDRTGTFARRGFKEYIGAPRAEQFVHPGDIVVAQTDLTQGAEVIGWAVRVPKVAEYESLVASLDLAIVRPLPEICGEYLLGVLRSQSFRHHCHARMSGTTVLHLGRGAIESYRFPLPDIEAMEGYAVSSASRLELQDSLNYEILEMIEARDALLPLLMSGRLRVKDVERTVEEVV